MKIRRGHAEASGDRPRDLYVPAIVIAHDAWIDAMGWREVIAHLQAEGLTVMAAQNPLSSLADDVDAVTRAINHLHNPVVLVGHGYGGTVITQAGNHSRVAALVYIAAFAPDPGESTTNAHYRYPPPQCVAGLVVDSGGYLYLSQDAVSEFLVQDQPTADSLVLSAAQQPIRASALLDRVETASWQAKPCWYVVAAEDRMISPALQREIANKIHARVFILPAGHAPFLSRPKQTAEVILAAAENVRRSRAGESIAAPHDRE